MKKYRVKVIQHLLKNNKIARSGDLVTEAQLTGKPEDLVSQKFIEPVNESEEKSEKEKAAEDQAAKEAFDKAYEAGELDKDQLDSITKNEIYEYAKKHSLKYDDAAKKDDLVEQVLKAEKVEE